MGKVVSYRHYLLPTLVLDNFGMTYKGSEEGRLDSVGVAKGKEKTCKFSQGERRIIRF
jgi:hypothetical protein